MSVALPFFPAAHVDEPVTSYIRRVRPIWSKTRFTETSTRDIDKVLYRSGAALPLSPLIVGIACQLTNQSSALVIERHTLWPVADMLAPPRGAAVDRLTSIAAGKRSASSCIPTASWSYGVCIDCLREDIGRYGFATWRRKHLFSAMRVCHEHASPLSELCASCNERGVLRVGAQASPHSHCLCGASLVGRMPGSASSRLIQSELRVSEMLAGMTSVAELVGVRARKVLGTVYLARAEKVGLARFTKRPNLPELMDFILARHGVEFAASRNLVSMQEWIGLLRLFNRDRTRSAMPGAHAIVASALFDNVEHLLHELRRARGELSRGECNAPD